MPKRDKNKKNIKNKKRAAAAAQAGARKLKCNFDLSGDRLIIHKLSKQPNYINNRSLLITHAGRRANMRAPNCASLGLSRRRCAKFVRSWASRGDDVEAQGIGYFDGTNHNNSGRKRKLSINQMWDLFLHYFNTTNIYESYGIYKYAAMIKNNYNLSVNTIVTYLKIFMKAYKKLKQPHKLTPLNKQTRINNCNFWINKGKNYYLAEYTTIDETTVYTNTIPYNDIAYTPIDNLNAINDFNELATQARFRSRPLQSHADVAPPAVTNPTDLINNWDCPPIPFETVCYFIYLIILFIYLFILFLFNLFFNFIFIYSFI